MLNAKITRRILGSFLLLSLTGLILFGIMLMTYFHDETTSMSARGSLLAR